MKFGWSLLSSTPLTPLKFLKYISQHVCIIVYMLGLLAWLVFQDLLLLFALESMSGEYEQMMQYPLTLIDDDQGRIQILY